MAVNRVPNPLVGAVTEEVDPLALKSANNLSDLANVATAKTNLSLGTAADEDVGAAEGNIPVLGAGGELEVPVAFTPAVPGDWLVAPTTLGDAVDEAGARLSAGKVYRVGTDRDYTTVQDAVDAANAAGGGQVIIDPGSWGAVTLRAGVELRGTHKRGVRIGKLTLNLGEAEGNRSSHEGAVRDLRITGGAGEYDIDDTGALGAQLVIFENVDVYPHATGLGVRLQDSTVGGAGLRTVYVSQGVGLYVHNGGDGTSHMLDLGSWLAVYSGNLVVNGDDADGPALRLREGALLNAERGAGYVRVTGYTTLDNASSFAAAPSIFMPTWEVRTNTASPFQFAGANGVVAVGEVIGSTNLGQVAATLVTGIGALAWTRVEVSGYVDTSASTTTDLLQILAALLAPGAGGGPGLVQVTGGAASQDAGNVDAATWRTALGLEDLAVTERSDLREVTAGGTDGQVLTSDGANGYTWEDATGGGGGGGIVAQPYIVGTRYDVADDGAWDLFSADTSYINGGHSNDGEKEIIASGASEFRALSYNVDMGAWWIAEWDHDSLGTGDGGFNGVYWGMEVNAEGRRTRIGIKTNPADSALWVYEGLSNTFLSPLTDAAYTLGRSVWRLKREDDLVSFYIDEVPQFVAKWAEISTATASAARLAVGRIQSQSTVQGYIYAVRWLHG